MAVKEWIARQWPQVSTKIGAWLLLASTIGPQIAQQLADVSPGVAHDATIAGAIASTILIIWNEGKNNG